MAIEVLTLNDGTKKYRGKIGRVIDGKRKVFNTPFVSSRAEAVRLEKLLGEQYPITRPGRVEGKDYTDASRGVIPDKEATKKYKKIIDDKFKKGSLTTKKWSEMSEAQRANIASAYRFQKNLDERIIKFKLGGKNIELPKGMRFSSLSRAVDPVKAGVKKLQKWNKNPTPENWSKIFRNNTFGRNLRSYISGRDSTAGIKISDEAKNIFDAVDIKQFVNSKDVDTIINLDQTLKPAGAQLGSIKARELVRGKMINELNFVDKDPEVKKFIADQNFGNKNVRKVSESLAKKLKTSPSIAARRIQELASAYVGKSEYLDLKSNNAKFMQGVDRIMNIVESSPFRDFGSAFKRDLYEKEISRALLEKPSFMQNARAAISALIPKGFSVDEIRNIATGAKVGSPGYSIFIQGITDKANLNQKRKVDNAIEKAEKKLQELSPFDPDYDEKRNIIKNKYNAVVKTFVKEANQGYKGNLPVRAFELSFNEPSKSVSRFKNLPDNVSTLIQKTFDDHGYSFKIPKDVKTIYEVEELTKTNPSFLRSIQENVLSRPRLFSLIPGVGLAGVVGTGVYNALKKDVEDLRFASAGETPLEVDNTGAAIGGGVAATLAGGLGIKYNKEIGAFVTGNEDIVSQADLKKYAADNPMEVKVGEEPLKAATNKSVLANVGKAMARIGAPLPTAALDAYFIGKQVQEGKGTAEIASNPLNWVGLATMEPLTKISGIAEGGGLNKALRLGLNPATIRGISRFAGLPGLAVSTAMTAYDQYQKYKDGEGFIFNLLNQKGTE